MIDPKEIYSWPRVTGRVSPVNRFGTVSVGKKGVSARYENKSLPQTV